MFRLNGELKESLHIPLLQCSTAVHSPLCSGRHKIVFPYLFLYHEDCLDDRKKMTELDYVRRLNYIAETCKMTEFARTVNY